MVPPLTGSARPESGHHFIPAISRFACSAKRVFGKSAITDWYLHWPPAWAFPDFGVRLG
jgi:hypothetical protein